MSFASARCFENFTARHVTVACETSSIHEPKSIRGTAPSGRSIRIPDARSYSVLDVRGHDGGRVQCLGGLKETAAQGILIVIV